MKAFQYSILRYRESKSGGELVNIGLLMVVPIESKVYHFVSTKHGRLSRFFDAFDGDGYRLLVDDLERRFRHILTTEDIGNASLPELQSAIGFTAESCFQWSTIMRGVHPKPQQRFKELQVEFVTRHDESFERDRCDEDDADHIHEKSPS